MTYQTFFLISDPDNLDYPIYIVYDKSRVLDYFGDIFYTQSTTITEIELGDTNPDFKISILHNNNYLTSHVIKSTKYSLLDVNTVQMLLDYKDPDYELKSTCHLYIFYMTKNRFDICDYLIASNIKYIDSFGNISLLNSTNLNNYQLIKYIIDNNEFFNCRYYYLMLGILRYTKFYDLVDYILELISKSNNHIDYNSLLMELFSKFDCMGSLINSEIDAFQIKKLIDGNYFDEKVLFDTVICNNFELTKYLVEKGFNYDFDTIINSNVKFDVLKYFIELGNYLTDDHIYMILCNTSCEYYEKIIYLVDNNHITEKYFTKSIISRIIHFEFYLLDYLTNKLNIIELIDLDLLMKTSIRCNETVMVKKCIDYGINPDEYMEFAIKHDICIAKKLMELGGNIPDNMCIYNPDAYLTIESIDIILENNYDSLENLLPKIINNCDSEIIMYIIKKLTDTTIIIPHGLIKIFIRSYYWGRGNDIYSGIINSNLNFDDYQQIIIGIMRKEYNKIEQLIFSSTYYNSIELLFVVTLSENIELFKLLLEINCNDNNYLSWAFVFSIGCFKLMKYIVDNYNIDIYQRQFEVCIMSLQNYYRCYNQSDQIKFYLLLMGYEISCFNNKKNYNENIPLVKFMREMGVTLV
ncbi:putative ankyrin repeat protein [Acanthamoeba castellanii mimivirus]|uniref:Putative ankyrin repeat protein L766 n=5 Tax=Mimivirus TaxID=315393 RepID=YL766_MIMIV|nr:putative ankyrin repeat protein [Acanthamoeba polyphaga mimivirus]Q5UPQ2.1 RecName: Full=Putative ankyrin repeat protein L766 [Acanthamoeba polyphaga mimivirus]AEQ60980.1 hypothetical protein [Acanthamoeba castellanii mamavirus]ALR84387.1 hypothetical protein [Niemeyer virus]AMK62040.1 hypothetical protein [Samba virus]AMZ03209.1 putative ankyrin repeat protein [Mimivirus Bombay]EJN40618.1 hypothetical protein lvs_L669 [Acanthamoeba polyphaga lentillevirus]BAV61902.1 putative ankyrin repe